MVFSSIIFLFAFLPVTLLLYHLICLPIWRGSSATIWRHLGNLFLLAVSLLFYFWGEKWLVWVFICTVFIDYVCALLISSALTKRGTDGLTPGGERTWFQRCVLAASIASNMALLGYFKYFNFGVGTFNTLADRAGLNSLAWKTAPNVLLPLGISFFVFHSMSYTIDVYRGHVKATRNLIDYASYVLMFPQLVAGPIVRYSLVAEQFLERRLNVETFASGAARFLCGLSKKVLVANTVSTLADEIFALPPGDVHFQLAWLGMIAYTLQIYFDFSGYSDMAIGLGRMLGFELPINFDYPYTAASVREFWQRWHISLSTWFRDYLYFPLGGSRTSLPRAYGNLVTVFFLCGLWHGAKWTFVAWGFYHGLFLVLERIGLERVLGKAKFPRHIYTLTVLLAGWVLFRADTFGQALSIWRSLAGLNPGNNEYPIQWFVTADIRIALAAGVIFCMPVVPILQQGLNRLVTQAEGLLRSVYLGIFCGLRLTCAAVSMLLCSGSLATGTHNPFIYFRF